MADRDWDKELSKIDKRLESVSDAALFPGAKSASPAAKADVDTKRATTRSWGAFLRLGLSVAVGVGILWWPYPARCGLGLVLYLGAVSAVVAGGVWSAIWTWRHQTGRAHILSLLLILWGLVLAAADVLPRTGYATPTTAHPSTWACS